MSQVEVGRDDLRRVRRGLKALGDGSEKELRRQLKARVADPVAARIKGNIPLGPGRPPGHWRAQVRGGATQRGAYVQWGRNLEYPPIQEFAEKWGGRQGEGRYVYPEIERSRPQLQRVGLAVLDTAARRAGLTLER